MRSLRPIFVLVLGAAMPGDAAGPSTVSRDPHSMGRVLSSNSKQPGHGRSKSIMDALKLLEDRSRKPNTQELNLMLEYGGYHSGIFEENVDTSSILRALEDAEEDDGWGRMLGAMRSMGIGGGGDGAGMSWFSGDSKDCRNGDCRNTREPPGETPAPEEKSAASGEKSPPRRLRKRSLSELTVLTPDEERELTLHLLDESENFEASLSSFEERLRRLKERVVTAKRNRVMDLKEHMKTYLTRKRMGEVEVEERRRRKLAEEVLEKEGRRLEEMGEEEIGQTKKRILKEKVERHDRRLREEWDRRLEIVEDETSHYMWNDPFAFLGQHALNGFFEIDTKKGWMRKHQLSENVLRELQAKKSIERLEEAVDVEALTLLQIETLQKEKAFERDTVPGTYHKLKRMQLRRLDVAEQALHYNRRLLGEEKFLCGRGNMLLYRNGTELVVESG